MADGTPPATRLCGAGVLPFSIDDQGRLRFVLAKERYVAHWRGSSRWSGFEGGTKHVDRDGNKHSETDVENAVREFVEESLGVLTPSEDTIGALTHALASGQYAMKVNIVTDSARAAAHPSQQQPASLDPTAPPPSVPSLHTTYVVRFPHDDTIPQRFEALRRELIGLQQLAETLATLRASFRAGYPFLREDDRVDLGDETFFVSAVLEVAMFRGVLASRLLLRARGGSRGARVHRMSYVVPPAKMAEAQAYTEWVECTTRATDAIISVIGRVPRGCVTCQRAAHGRVRRVSVNSDFLEKACVRLFSFEELTNHVAHRAPSGELFRPYFVMVLRAVLERFAPCIPSTPARQRAVAT